MNRFAIHQHSSFLHQHRVTHLYTSLSAHRGASKSFYSLRGPTRTSSWPSIHHHPYPILSHPPFNKTVMRSTKNLASGRQVATATYGWGSYYYSYNVRAYHSIASLEWDSPACLQYSWAQVRRTGCTCRCFLAFNYLHFYPIMSLVLASFFLSFYHLQRKMTKGRNHQSNISGQNLRRRRIWWPLGRMKERVFSNVEDLGKGLSKGLLLFRTGTLTYYFIIPECFAT